MTQIPISDPADARIVAYTGLTDEALRRHREGPEGDLAGIFICEGTRVMSRALAAGLRPVSVLVATDMIRRLPPLEEDVPVYVASPDLVETVIGFRFHRGFVAAFHRPAPLDPEVLARGSRRILICENMTNPTNLGVTIRSAAALGMDALLLDPTSCDPLYRRVVRVSMGSVFSFPFARLERFPQGLELPKGLGFHLVGLSPEPDSVPIGELDQAERMGLVLGAEGPGLSAATMAHLDQITHIPMQADVDSLNVGAAAAIASYVVGGLTS
ncbi:MAG: RNA methyltransferase [Acidimicrobiia bacterium]